MLDKIIKSRRSIKDYKLKKPDWRVILECIDSVRYSPMAGNNFSLRFILVDNPELIQKIAEISEQEFIKKAQYIVVVCSDSKKTKILYEDRAEKYIKQQAGAAIQNFLLKITESGLSTNWVGHFYEDKLKRILKVPEEIEVEALFPIGYSNEKPKKRETIDFDRIMFFNKYGNRHMNPENKLDV
jgi:nitroreductase